MKTLGGVLLYTAGVVGLVVMVWQVHDFIVNVPTELRGIREALERINPPYTIKQKEETK